MRMPIVRRYTYGQQCFPCTCIPLLRTCMSYGSCTGGLPIRALSPTIRIWQGQETRQFFVRDRICAMDEWKCCEFFLWRAAHVRAVILGANVKNSQGWILREIQTYHSSPALFNPQSSTRSHLSRKQPPVRPHNQALSPQRNFATGHKSVSEFDRQILTLAPIRSALKVRLRRVWLTSSPGLFILTVLFLS